MTHHATVIAFGDRAVLLRGASGAGKSDLALRLVALPRDALRVFGIEDVGEIALVADDRVALTRHGAELVATCPSTIRGKLEVRGLGIVDTVRTRDAARVALVVDLVSSAAVERLPDATTIELLGVQCPIIRIAPFEASAPLKIALVMALRHPAT